MVGVAEPTAPLSSPGLWEGLGGGAVAALAPDLHQDRPPCMGGSGAVG